GDAKVPNNFPGYAYNTSEGKFGHPVDRGQYETELQNIHFDGTHGGALIKWSWNDIRYAKNNPDKPFYFTPQVHLFYQNHGIYYPPNIQREPTNEEINAMTNIMLTYGAKGILYFEYASLNDIGNTSFYSIGLHNYAVAWGGGGALIANQNPGFINTIKPVSNEIPAGFELFQNYPNPFNLFSCQLPGMLL
ncbi:MAG: hypothetical protein NTV87_05510, partial [Ignavibacteriae bacterium]|nr:hypothetical protein [Ignavibacteriota bacterium]